MTVRQNTEAGSYEALVGDQVVGVVVYEQRGDRMVFLHTNVRPEFRGRGVAADLVRAALDDVAAHGRTFTNYCGFITDFVARNPSYEDLVDAEHPGHIMPKARDSR
jgi:uncharacterized protein